MVTYKLSSSFLGNVFDGLLKLKSGIFDACTRSSWVGPLSASRAQRLDSYKVPAKCQHREREMEKKKEVPMWEGANKGQTSRQTTYQNPSRQEPRHKPDKPALPTFPHARLSPPEDLANHTSGIARRIHSLFLAMLHAPSVLRLDGLVQTILRERTVDTHDV